MTEENDGENDRENDGENDGDEEEEEGYNDYYSGESDGLLCGVVEEEEEQFNWKKWILGWWLCRIVCGLLNRKEVVNISMFSHLYMCKTGAKIACQVDIT